MTQRKSVPGVRKALLSWFKAHARDLPWRHTDDPYAIWVSEVMLQQTQVSVVLRYWAGFLARFPDLQALAAATLDEVLGQWRGLGYYARARNLHRAAQAVVSAHGGRLPNTLEGLRTLPGFGRYTAGAVASIAFGLPAPIVDGNVARVLSRLFLLRGAPGDRAREATLWELAEQLVQGVRPGDLNESLMELGATVCLPRSPRCPTCPVRRHCQALAEGLTEVIPEPKARLAKKSMQLAVALCRKGSATLVARRPDGGLFGGLWELPAVPVVDGRHDLLALLGKGARLGPRLTTVRRTLTHRELTLDVYPGKPGASFDGPKGYSDWRWATPAQMRAQGMSAAMSAALEAAVAAIA